MDLNIGTVLHGKSYDYKIVKTLGQGTFGITYLASVKMKGALGSLDSEVLVAVKEFFMRDFNGRKGTTVTYSSRDGSFAYYKKKFKQEAENLSNLHNSGIIKVIELFEENQTTYYVMEYISERNLDEQIKVKGRLSSSESIDYAMQIAKALSYMHQNKMLHLDLKPNNVMIRKNNEIVLIDFGLSKRFNAFGIPETSTSIGHGTPGYAPVEQANYEGNDDGLFPATMDIYAFGATLFKMLTGHRPAEASIVLNEGFPFDELEDVNVPMPVIEIVSKCMEPIWRNRYKTVKEVIQALASIECDTVIYPEVAWNGAKDTEKRHLNNQGFYKIAKGESEYGTYRIEKVPVTSSMDFPKCLNIKLWDNSRQGKSFEVIMNGHFEDGNYNFIRTWDKGQLLYEYKFDYGIPDDIKDYIISHGFLSTEHWEEECSTSQYGDNFGMDASITMVLSNGNHFIRRVTHAHPSYHHILLDELLELLGLIVIGRNWLPMDVSLTLLNFPLFQNVMSKDREEPVTQNLQNKEITLSPVPIRETFGKIVITYSCKTPEMDGYELIVAPSQTILKSTGGHFLGMAGKEIFIKDRHIYSKLINEIKSWKYLPQGRTLGVLEYSESPNQISILFYEGGTPYLVLDCESIYGNNYGNLVGDAFYYNDRIISLIPDFERLLQKSNESMGGNKVSNEEAENEESKKAEKSKKKGFFQILKNTKIFKSRKND